MEGIISTFFKLRRDHRKNFLRVGRRWDPILGYVLKRDKKKKTFLGLKSLPDFQRDRIPEQVGAPGR